MNRLASLLLIVSLGSACGKKPPEAPAGADAAVPVTGSADASPSSADAASADATGASDPNAPDVSDEAKRRERILEDLSKIELPGFQRVRGQVQGGFVTLQLQSTTPNAKGSTVSVEATIGFCADCKQEDKAALEARREQLLLQYGELHAKNEKLVFDIADFEIGPERKAVTTYVKSFIDDGTTRASMHGLEVMHTDNGATLRFQVYPQSPFPQSAEEHDAAMTRPELEAAVKTVFAAIVPILWAPL